MAAFYHNKQSKYFNYLPTAKIFGFELPVICRLSRCAMLAPVACAFH
jgi:hypothetical protein